MLREYRFVQKAVDRLNLRIMPTPGFTEAHAERLRQGLERLLGPGVTVEIAEVAEIPPELSGKRLVVKSEVT